MDRRKLSGRKPLLAVAIFMMLGLVSGCEEGSVPAFLQPGDKPVASASKPGQSTKLVERDIEAPEVFQVTEAGLWDGRPSLGGVWVAHPSVKEPQRVIIRNSANGKFVIGALFRREREIPGPRIQASSDAASALGMLAGAPSKLNVTALIREPVPQEPEVVEDPGEVAEEPAEKTVADTSGSIAETALAPVTRPEARPGSLSASDTAPKPNPVAESARDPIAAAAAAIEAAGKSANVASATAARPTPPASARPATGSRSSSLAKPYIQIGIFSVKANADQTAGQMRSAGMVPTVFDQKSNGKRFWRVVVGPTRTSSERASLLKNVKAAGFSDAYFVTN